MRTRRLAAMAALTLLVLTGCSDDGDDGASGDDAPAASDGGGLTTEDRDAFLEAARLGTSEGEDFVVCLGDEVKAAVDAGDLSADDVRAWSAGQAPDGPVQDLISTPEVLGTCGAAGFAPATTGAG